MYCIQRLSLCDERDRRLVLDHQNVATIGSGSAVSFRLHMSFGLPLVCLKLWMEEDTCIARNVTGDPELVLLNGQPLFDIVQLEDGDSLQVGSDQFLVLLAGREAPDPSPAAPVVAVPVVTPVAERTDALRTFRTVPLNRSVSRHEPRDARWTLEDFLGRLRSLSSVIQFVNFRHAGVEVPRRREMKSDLFEKMPAEVTEIYSLHTITDAALGTHLDVARQLIGRDACVWAVPVSDAQTSLADAKLYYAWLARPSVLEMTLRQSPRDFCVSLMKPFRAFILPECKGINTWCILSASSLKPEELITGK
ncbi:MAG: hypothetical protein U0996_23490 [Planctomycetaceae bacterium]